MLDVINWGDIGVGVNETDGYSFIGRRVYMLGGDFERRMVVVVLELLLLLVGDDDMTLYFRIVGLL